MSRSRRLVIVLALAVVAVATQVRLVRAQHTANEFARLLADDGAADDAFGRSVAISGNAVIISAVGDDDNGTVSGSAYIFRFDGTTWNQEAKLLASDGAAFDFFSVSVAISGSVAVVGADGDDDNGSGSGSVYVFRFDGNTWNQEAKILAADGARGDRFGHSVAISGNTFIVGADADDDTDFNAGSAYVFRHDGSAWVQEAKLLTSDSWQHARFGTSVSIDDDLAIIGALNADGNVVFTFPGAAYIFRFDSVAWNQQAKLLASDGARGDQFGISVSISGDTALVGADNDADNGQSSGSAYTFRFDGASWNQETKLVPSDGAVFDTFGFAVSVCGDQALVGANSNDANDFGAAYTFRFGGTTWTQQFKLLPSDRDTADGFGTSVATSGDQAVIGKPKGRNSGITTGSAYIFTGLIDCNGNFISDASDIASGTSQDCNSNAIPDECETCGDLDGDGDVDADDFAIFLGAFGLGTGAVGFEPCADFDGDGAITFVDYQQWLQCYRSFVGNPLAPPPMPESVGDMDGSGTVDGSDIQPFIDAMLEPATAGLLARFMADANGDGAVDSADVGEFVGLLLSQS